MGWWIVVSPTDRFEEAGVVLIYHELDYREGSQRYIPRLTTTLASPLGRPVPVNPPAVHSKALPKTSLSTSNPNLSPAASELRPIKPSRRDSSMTEDHHRRLASYPAGLVSSWFEVNV